MAHGRFVQFNYGYEKKQIRIFVRATIGAAGAVTLVTAPSSQGVASITKLGTAGQYQIKLKDIYQRLLSADVMTQNATGISASPAVGIVSGSTSLAAAGGAAVTIQLSNAGSATNPASGDVLLIELVFADSNV